MPKYDLIEAEIKWCAEHRHPLEKVYQDGFIAGLQHALWLMKSRPIDREAEPECECNGKYYHAGCPLIWHNPMMKG
jgi:hypothetical protein